jgi:hypothetical protein
MPTTQRRSKQVIIYHDVEQGSEQWLIDRDGMFTGSNADKLLDHAKSKRIVAGIVSKYAAAENLGFGGNFYTKRGHLLEDEALELTEVIDKTKIEHTGYVTNSLYPGCLYSPDGFTAKYLYEVKCFSEKAHLKILMGDIPLKILAQIHYGMTIMDKKAAKLVIYNPRFAKRQIKNDHGELVDNPLYDPSKAYSAIILKRDRDIHNNFKRILTA